MQSNFSNIPQVSNTGVRVYIDEEFTPVYDKSYSIDWLTFTTGKIQYGNDQEPLMVSVSLIDELLILLKSNFSYLDLTLENVGSFGYRKKMKVSDGIFILFYGPVNKFGEITTMVNITGSGCDKFNKSEDWLKLINFMFVKLDAKATRLDLAIDDFQGKEITMNEFFDCIKKEKFTRSGSPKSKINWNVNNFNNYDDGCTVNFYSTSSDIRLVSYNKKAEQESKGNQIPNTPQWLRHELRFYNKQAESQLNLFYSCLLYELTGEQDDKFVGGSIAKFISSCLYESLKLYEDSNDTNQARWKEHPGWIEFIGDISNIKFNRGKTKRDRILKTKTYFEDSYSKFLLKMYHVFGWDYLVAWIKELMYVKRNELDPDDFVSVNDLRIELGLKPLHVSDIIISNSHLQLFDKKEFELINKYILPGREDFLNYELGKDVTNEKKKLIEQGIEENDLRFMIKERIKKLELLINELE